MSDQTPRYTDDQLSAYLDGEFPMDEATTLEEALKTSPSLQDRLERLGSIDALLAPAFEELVSGPMPEGVMVLLTKKDATPPEGAQILAFPNKVGRFFKSHGLPMAAAASLALVATSIVSGPKTAGSGTFALAERPDLVELLAAVPSSQRIDLNFDQQAEVVLSYASNDVGFCREFALYDRTQTMNAIACNQGNAWTLEVAEFSAPTVIVEGSYTTASSPGAALEAFVDETMTEDALSADQEAALIKGGWSVER